ncbi:NYN domain-containing protein [Bradyrhizobium sp. CCBAU 21365]|uniref:NYN domain-containing protein n=1 Tax=Bradyrhizobium sp. CCBAU 21365 TaxID=1325083 RepID=UPI00188D244F|nr:NYN domain-containing protein [Bradyrhizobium sp. CCBAU 21365]QOZ17451.1 NYN domain-containing protein [Bradyrhizobium sp. CCBAU 21365]
MHRVAVFVDAGYLFAQGSIALSGGSKKARADLVLDAPAIIEQLRSTALGCASGCSLLRIYWYDGAAGSARLTGDQALLASLNDVKVRLGFINSAGQQKGVDSLIVTDLIELARQKAIHDAVLLSGDEDVRVGVQIAQNYGVRIHLVGISPARANQSQQLMHEADTRQEWAQDTIRRFLSLREKSVQTVQKSAPKQPQKASGAEQPGNASSAQDADLVRIAAEFVSALEQTEIEGLEAYWKTDRGLPPELDRRLLPLGREAIGQDLDAAQKKLLRTQVQKLVKETRKK